jgi:hypothetical protein
MDGIAFGISKEKIRAIMLLLFSFFFLAIGFLIVWFSKKYIPIENNIVYIFLFLTPAIFYLLFSGRVTELKGGGFEARFKSIAEHSFHIPNDPIPNDYVLNVEKRGMDYLEDIYPQLLDSKSIFLTIVVFDNPNYPNPNPFGRYLLGDMLGYIEKLSNHKGFRFIVFVDSNKKLLAFVPKDAMHQLLATDNLATNLINDINNGEKGNLLKYPHFKKNSIYLPTTYLKALKEMKEREVSVLAIVDNNNQPRRIIERDEILGKIILDLAKDD